MILFSPAEYILAIENLYSVYDVAKLWKATEKTSNGRNAKTTIS